MKEILYSTDAIGNTIDLKNPKFCNLDFETYSECDIKLGATRYAQDKSTEIICMAYSFDQKNVKLWTPDMPLPMDFIHFIGRGGIIRAWNCNFEYAILNHTAHRLYGWPEIKPEQCQCTMTDALTLALPASLDSCGEVLGLDILKNKRGKYLIQKLSKPRKATKNKPFTRLTKEMEPDLFEEFYNYCMRDVEAEIAIYNALPRHIKDKEQKLYELTLKINQNGLHIDKELVDAIMRDKKSYESIVNKKVEKFCGLSSTNSRPKSLEWLIDNGCKLDGYTKKDIEEALKRDDLSDNVRTFLYVRNELGRTPIKKYDFINKALCNDNTIKDNIIMNKSTTGRYAGSGFQIQNLPRDAADDPEKLISQFKNGESIEGRFIINEAISLIRNSIIAPPNKKLIVSDFSSIENRVLAWVVDDFETLNDFVNGVDQYKKTAGLIFNTSYNEVSKEQRQLGKIAVLGCGYGAGGKAFHKVCVDGWGVKISEDQAQEIVDGYRTANPKIVKLWYGLLEKAIEAVTTNRVTSYKRIKFRVMKDFLYMRLPSGRLLAYYKPLMKKVMAPWGQEKISLTHLGTNTYTRKWERLSVSPGRLTENLIQAIARDFLIEAMFRVDNAGYTIHATVHDEIIASSKEGSIEELNHLMSIIPEWGEGCPIDAEGFEGYRYKK